MRKAAAVWLAATTLLLTSCGVVNGSDSPDGGQAGGTAPDGTAPSSAAPADGSTEDGGDSAGGGGDGADSPSCEETENWTLQPDVQDGSSADPVWQVRAGRHDCFDRVVFDLDGTGETGFDVSYQPQVRQPGSGTPLPVAGGAALQVIVRSPVPGVPGIDSDRGSLGTAGDHLVPESDLAAWGSLRAVRYGGYFEGQTTFALGAREELPFRAFTWLNEDRDVREVIIDIAHDAN